jgi:hypothetical protein
MCHIGDASNPFDVTRRSPSSGTQVVQQRHLWRRVIMQARRKIAVAGATGTVGRHVVDVLEAE